MAADSIALVLDEMDFLWRSDGRQGALPRTSGSAGTIPKPSGRTDTFDVVVRQFGQQQWAALRPMERAESLRSWLTSVADDLCDGTQKRRWRFRRAWEIAPDRMLGVDFDEINILAVAAEIERDVARLDVLKQHLVASESAASRRSELEALVQKYQHPPRGMDEWAYLVEAVRVGAVVLPLFHEVWHICDETVDPLPFVLVVYDAMCPGMARPLSENVSRMNALTQAVALWRALHNERYGHDTACPPSKAKHTLLWKQLQILTKRGGDSDSLRRTWPRVRASVFLDLVQLLYGLARRRSPNDLSDLELVPHDGSELIDFTPTSGGQLLWVERLLHAVRHALPPRMNPAGSIIDPEAIAVLSIPPAFMAEAEALLPPVQRGTRGPEPMSNRDALPWILHKFRNDIGWKSEDLPSGTKYQRRFSSWSSHTRKALAELAEAHGVLHPQGAKAMRRG